MHVSNPLSKIAKKTSKIVYNTVGGLRGTAGNNGRDEANHERKGERNQGARLESWDVECSLGVEHPEVELADLPCHSRKWLIPIHV